MQGMNPPLLFDQKPKDQSPQEVQDGKHEKTAHPSPPGQIADRNQPVEHEYPDNPGYLTACQVESSCQNGLHAIP
jgi:hypothetical protein